jgi:hypothetical protein
LRAHRGCLDDGRLLRAPASASRSSPSPIAERSCRASASRRAAVPRRMS